MTGKRPIELIGRHGNNRIEGKKMTTNKSQVFMTDLSAGTGSGLREKLMVLLKRVGLEDVPLEKRLVAVKMHFGEKGNNAYVRPLYVSWITGYLKKRGARPFLTDTCTLYVGSRGEAVSHYQAAVGNGFDPAVIGAPVIIAGGLRGTRGEPVQIYGKHFEEVEIAPEILDSDILMGVTHFKGHEMSGFGGTLKNFGMGAASRGGKLAMHSRVTPYVNKESCNGCRSCIQWCSFEAIVPDGEKVIIDETRCSGCGACLSVCPQGAIRIVWDEQTADMQEKMAEYAAGALKGHIPDRSFFLNFITQVSPLCDCYPFADSPIVPDIGILASTDPVALDQASADLVNSQTGLASSALPEEAIGAGVDKFKALHPGVDWEIQLDHAVTLGLGNRDYSLVDL
jgi:uncharacterized Fe-S center protein